MTPFLCQSNPSFGLLPVRPACKGLQEVSPCCYTYYVLHPTLYVYNISSSLFCQSNVSLFFNSLIFLFITLLIVRFFVVKGNNCILFVTNLHSTYSIISVKQIQSLTDDGSRRAARGLPVGSSSFLYACAHLSQMGILPSEIE